VADGCRKSACRRRLCAVVVVASLLAVIGTLQGLLGRFLCIIALLALTGCFSTNPARHAPSIGKRSHHVVIRYVRANDTLYSIGKKFGVDYRLIAKRNHIRYPYRIYVGQRLYINRAAPGRHDATAEKIRRVSIPHRSVRKNSAHHRSSHRRVHKKGVRKLPHLAKARGYKGRLRWPVKGVVTSKFGPRGSRMHDGIDIGAREGTPVHAAASGVVVYADSRLSGYGKLIIIRHAGNLFTAYGHNSRMLVRKGAHVRAGEVISRVGHTGRATGPHLHFEVRRGSTPVNPLAYLPR